MLARCIGPVSGLLLLLVLMLLAVAVPSQAEARARLLEDENGDGDAQPAETRRSRGLRGVDAYAEGRRVRDDGDRDRERDRDADDAEDINRRRGAPGGSSGEREWFRDPGYYGYGNFPSIEVHDAVVANARAATARAIFRRAENALNASVRKAVRTFQGSGELREASVAEKDAYAAYSIARRRALQTVLEDPKYRAIMSLRAELSDRINYKRVNRSVDERTDRQVMDDVLAMATLKMNYAADARAMEQLALAVSDEHKDAQAKLRQAATRVSELKTDFDEALRNDQDLLAARRNLEDARIARLTASAYLKGASIAAEEALDFAYYLNRYSRYSGAGYQDYRDYYPYSSSSRLPGY